MSIRVLFVQPVLAPYSIPRFQALAESGRLDVHVALEAEAFDERPGWNPKPIPGCRVHVMRGLRKTKTIRSAQGGFTESYTKMIPYGLPATIASVQPDVVVVCNPTQYLFALLSRLSRAFRLGVILEDTLVSERRKHPLIQWARKRLYRRADFFFVFSDDAKAYAESIGVNAPLFKTSWSVGLDWLQAGADGMERKAPGESAEVDVQYLCVGSLSKRKGVLPLLKAWLTFAKDKTDVRLVYVGEGEMGDDMERICREAGTDTVQMLGHLPYDEVKNIYLASDVFVFPTLEDVYGLVVTEAMAYGLPVLTTRYSGARELVIEDDNGYLFDPLDHQAIIDVLEKSYRNRDRLSAMGSRSRDIIRTLNHRDVMAQMERDLVASVEGSVQAV